MTYFYGIYSVYKINRHYKKRSNLIFRDKKEI